ncbi:MAG: 50S ribosomal protein L25, partial [Chloroflexota bacterium]
MEEQKIKVTKREVLGKQVKQLRAQGVTPVHLYGHGVASRALQADTTALEGLLTRAGTSALVDLTVDRARQPVKVLVREVQRNPITDRLLHVDFFQVSMTEAITVEVPVSLVGEPASRRLLVNWMVRNLSLRCLPGDIPAAVEVDIRALAEPGQAIFVKDLKLAAGIAVLNDPEDIVVRVETPEVREVVEKPVAEEAVAETAPAEEGKAEGKAKGAA